MRITVRVLALMLVLLVLGLPTFAQDAIEPLSPNMTVSEDGLITYAAESCDYGGSILSITALHPGTVQFQLCGPDPAFSSEVRFSAFGTHSVERLVAPGGRG